jgi:phospho-N-acetylmuramoyl-pentapeptide-transferase
MLDYLSQQILDYAHGSDWQSRLAFLRLFHYITVRCAGAAITSLLLSWWLGPRIIRWLKDLKIGQEYADKAEEAGLAGLRVNKKGTPTMGGILIVIALLLSTMLWANWNAQVELIMLTVLVLAGLGFYDDYAKILKQSGGGTPPRVKLIVQFALAAFVGLYLWYLPAKSELHLLGTKSVWNSNLVSSLMLPFYKYPIHVGIFGVAIVALAIVGSSNAVNLTDGLDGLAIGCTLIVGFVFLVFTYLAGNIKTAGYLEIPYVAGAGELTVFCSALLGAGLGFLWFNCHPAQVFMGDTGSLALGGAFGMVAVLIHQPFVLVIAGGVFVAEAVSVLLQTGWFKYTRLRTGAGQRIFLMAPLHHHFEKKGWHESQVVMRFFILCVLCAVVALATLKLR